MTSSRSQARIEEKSFSLIWQSFRRGFLSERLLLTYAFISALFLGALLLKFPASVKEGEHLRWIDAFFVATSAISVTGLMTVPISVFSDIGKFVIMLLIQVGGLGFITFTTFLLIVPGGRISIRNARIVRNYFLSSVEYNPRRIMRDILLVTFGVELVGAILVYLSFLAVGRPVTFFYALFHAVSAFCNAGFTLSDVSLFSWHGVPLALVVMTLLIFIGGLGFVAVSDIIRRLSSRRKAYQQLTLHTKITLITSLSLVVFGTFFFFLVALLSDRDQRVWYENLLGAYFHSVSTRTAGFSYQFLESLPFSAQIMTIPLMFIGAGPGSTGGGIKVTTFFLILIVIFRDDFRYNSFKLGNNQISIDSFRRAMVFFIRALMLLFLFVGLVFTAESKANSGHLFLSLVFETVSAFATVGLSMGITSFLSDWGKVVIMLAMFSGRVGLFSLAIYVPNPRKETGYQLPEQEVLLG